MTSLAALYKCGLKEDVAAKIARELPLEKYSDLLGMLTWYISQQRGEEVRFLQSRTCCLLLSAFASLILIVIGAELHEMLAECGFREEVIPRATFADEVLPHGLAESWIERFARGVYGSWE